MQRLQRKRLRFLLGLLVVAGLMATLAPSAPAAASSPQVASAGVEAASIASDDNSILCQGGSFIVPTQSIRDDRAGCQAPGNTTVRYGWHLQSSGAGACISVWSRDGWINTGCHSSGSSDFRDVNGWYSSWYPWIEGRNYSMLNAANIGWEWGT